MDIVKIIACLVIGGAIGGFVGSLPNGLARPKTNDSGNLDLGVIGALLFGAVAGLVSQVDALKTATTATDIGVASVLALGVGIGGANWVKAHSEKSDMQKAAAMLATKQPDPSAAANILGARSAREVLTIAQNVR